MSKYMRDTALLPNKYQQQIIMWAESDIHEECHQVTGNCKLKSRLCFLARAYLRDLMSKLNNHWFQL